MTTDHTDLIRELRNWSDGPGTDALVNRAADALEAMQADAARYRWLRRDITSISDIRRMEYIVTTLCEGDMDAAIDAAGAQK